MIGIKVKTDDKYAYITMNYRHIVENEWLDDLKYFCEPTEHHTKRVCVRFTTDRGTAFEDVRHRVFSFAQESTNYCNYSKDKFNKELTYIIPVESTLETGQYECFEEDDSIKNFSAYCSESGKHLNINNSNILDLHFLKACDNSQQEYMEMLKDGATAKQAKRVLNNALKAELNMCGFVDDWKHFFELRTALNAHPDMVVLAKQLEQLFNEQDLWKNSMC